VELARAAHEPTHAAALATLLILGAGVEPVLWPGRWRAAEPVQQRLAEALKAIGPDRGHALRWPLLELCSATLRPLARPWREDLLWLLRSQIDLDQRVTLVEWIYYVLLRARLMPLAEMAWPGDETPADAAGAVRWVVQLLARVSQQPELRAERLTNELIRGAHLSRTGQGHPPFDVGGLQASVAAAVIADARAGRVPAGRCAGRGTGLPAGAGGDHRQPDSAVRGSARGRRWHRHPRFGASDGGRRLSWPRYRRSTGLLVGRR